MPDTTEITTSATIQTQVEAAQERMIDKSIRVWHLVLAVFAICFTVFGAVTSSYNAMAANIVALQKQDAIFEQQISSINKKTDYYDSLIQRRDAERADTTTRLTRIETTVNLLAQSKMQGQATNE